MSKRHLVVMEFYILAETDEKAVEQAERIAEKRRERYDDQCTVTAVYDAPFAQKFTLIKGTETETLKY